MPKVPMARSAWVPSVMGAEKARVLGSRKVEGTLERTKSKL